MPKNYDNNGREPTRVPAEFISCIVQKLNWRTTLFARIFLDNESFYQNETMETVSFALFSI